MSRDPCPSSILAPSARRIGAAMDEAILRVLDHGDYIMGPEVASSRPRLQLSAARSTRLLCQRHRRARARADGAGHRPGDAVLCPSFTFAATAEAVAWFGATPVFVDVDEDSFNLDPASLEAGGRDRRRRRASDPAGVIPVDLFGQPADYDAIEPICAARRPVDAVRCRAELRRRAIAAARSAPSATIDDHQLLPGKAARLLRRRRRGLHRRRRTCRDAALDPRARPGRRQVRQRAHRPERPARHACRRQC